MAGFSDAVGIRYPEVMSGYVRGDGNATPPPGDDSGRFSLDLDIRIPRLREFLDGPLHVAEIAGGTVSWEPFVGKVAVHPGRLVFFRHEPAERRKFFDFEFTFPSGQDFDIVAEGHKDIHNDNGFDAASDRRPPASPSPRPRAPSPGGWSPSTSPSSSACSRRSR
jgi:hypothetical protein